MEWPKLKNIIILILLLVNAFLLFMVGTQERNTAQYREQTITDAVGILERNGVRLDRARVPEELELTPMAVERDAESEAALAAALLGECGATDLGSGRCAYEGERGWAEFRSNGSFNITFRAGAWNAADAGGEEKHAMATLEQVGLSGVLVSREDSGRRATLTLCQTWQETPVYSCRITLEYEDGCLQSIAGQRLMGTPQPDGKSELIAVPTALLRVLNGVNDLGDICNEITAMTPGYLLAASADAARLIPIWYVTTDTGTYSLNALTGALERA